MENFSYHVPFYVVTGGVKLSGHSSELNAGGVGLYDRNTFSVATAAGNGQEFFFAQGPIGGKTWDGYPSEGTHKSPFFLGKDVVNMYVSLPQTIQNEEWVLGFNGALSSKGLVFEKGKAVRVQLYFHGNPIYRFFGGPKTYVISYTPQEDCAAPCTEDDCPEPIVDCLTHTQALINQINEHVELQKFGVKAKLVNTPFTAGVANMTKYCLSVCDNGGALELQAVQSQVAPGVTVTRTSRVGAISTYQFCQLTSAAAPADFVQRASVLQAVCDVCPAGSTTVAAQDVYNVKRVLTAGTNLATDDAKDTFADGVGTTYGANDAGSTFVGQDGALGIAQIRVAKGAVVTASGADIVEFSHTQEATCNFAAPNPIAYTTCGTGISSSRTLKINQLNRLDCTNGDRLADLRSILAGVKGIQLNTLTKIAGVSCADDYTVQQSSIDCLDEDCLTNNVTFNYEDLPAFENQSWEVVPPVVTENANRRCGIRISAGYIDPKFGNCSFDPMDYYETEPIKMEVSLLVEDASACDWNTMPSQLQTQIGRSSRQSGEDIVRESIMKTDAYVRHIRQYDADPRMREAFDKNLLDMVDRKAFYKLYYVSFGASYGNYTFRKNEIKEDFTAVFAFKENDPSARVFEQQVLNVLTSKSGKGLKVIDVKADNSQPGKSTTTTTTVA